MDTSLYERLGGDVAMDAAVEIFYGKVLADERIKHFFANTDMARQRAKQKAFLTMVFGGPQNYSGKSMRAGHAHLGLNDSHFNAVVELLAATLKELGVPQNMIAEVAEIAETMRGDVLNK